MYQYIGIKLQVARKKLLHLSYYNWLVICHPAMTLHSNDQDELL